jgi:hypothetical protein
MPIWTAPKWIALNLTRRSQVKACIARSSCEICALLGIMQYRKIIPYQHFRTAYPSSFKVQDIQKKEQNTTEIN